MTTHELLPNATEAHEALVWCGSRIDPELRAAIDTLPEDMRHIAGYHLGWWDEHAQSIEAGGGKSLRPALALLAAEAVGGTMERAIPAAVAVELVHNFSLLHDDVVDADTTRRHRPTAWSVFGVSAAILAGDALLALASGVLADSEHSSARGGARLLNTAVQELIRGQLMDLAFEQRQDVGLSECERMARAKTGTLLGVTCQLGALFGEGTPEQVHHLRTFGEDLGLAFQHVDDLLGIWGNPAVTGKPAYSDLRGRKKTLPVVFALHSATPAGRELLSRYHRDDGLSEAAVAETAELMDEANARTWSQAQADQLLAGALDHLHAAHPVARVAELDALARLATHRDR